MRSALAWRWDCVALRPRNGATLVSRSLGPTVIREPASEE